MAKQLPIQHFACSKSSKKAWKTVEHGTKKYLQRPRLAELQLLRQTKSDFGVRHEVQKRERKGTSHSTNKKGSRIESFWATDVHWYHNVWRGRSRIWELIGTFANNLCDLDERVLCLLALVVVETRTILTVHGPLSHIAPTRSRSLCSVK